MARCITKTIMFVVVMKSIMPVADWDRAINALSLPDSGWKLLILAATYVVFIFSIIVQGLIAAKVAGRPGRTPDCRNDPFLCL